MLSPHRLSPRERVYVSRWVREYMGMCVRKRERGRQRERVSIEEVSSICGVSVLFATMTLVGVSGL